MNNSLDWGSLVPKAAIAAVIVYGGINWMFIGPEVATRVAAADHIPVCEANFKDMIDRAATASIAAVPPPQGRDYEAAVVEGYQQSLNDNWAYQSFQQDFAAAGIADLFGIDQALDGARRALAAEKQAAVNAYNQAINTIKEQTATELGRSGDVCGCIADAAIADTRNDWALFTASVSLYRSDAIRNFSDTMMQQYARGNCANVGKLP